MLFVVIRVGGDRIEMFFFFQAEDGIRDLVRSRGLGDVYKRQVLALVLWAAADRTCAAKVDKSPELQKILNVVDSFCLLYTSDAADERSSVDLGGRRIIKKKNTHTIRKVWSMINKQKGRYSQRTNGENATYQKMRVR